MKISIFWGSIIVSTIAIECIIYFFILNPHSSKIGIGSSFLSSPYKDSFGNPLVNGYFDFAGNNIAIVFIGKLLDVSKNNGSVYADIQINNDSSHPISQKFLLSESSTSFTLTIQHTPYLWSTTSVNDLHSLRGSNIVSTLQKFKGNEMIFLVSNFSTHNPLFTKFDQVLAAHKVCTQAFMPTSTSQALQRVSCIPYLYQAHIYVPS